MENQLLATFYIESPGALYSDTAVSARVQYQSGQWWYEDTSRLCCTVTNAHYEDGTGTRRRYKIDVFRSVNGEWDTWHNGEYVRYYPLSKAGTYPWRIQVLHNNNVVRERMIYVTVQPDVRVYAEGDRSEELGERIDLVTTKRTVVVANPRIETVDHEVASMHTLALARSNNYKGKVFVKTNVPVDLVSNDLTDAMPDSWNSRWMRLKEAIDVTRFHDDQPHQWYNPIQSDVRGKFVPFIADYDYDSSDSSSPSVLEYPYYDPVELGLEKPLLRHPLKAEASLQLYAKGVQRYTGSGATTATTDPIVLELLAVLKTLHAVTITPEVVTLDEDNNYTAFVAVEANDGADWTILPVDPRLIVTPASGIGRGAVVVKTADGRPQTAAEGWSFANVPLTVTSTVDAAVYPDIEGEYAISDTAEVHIEQYTPVRNALIPRQTGSFDHTLTGYTEEGRWSTSVSFDDVGSLADFPFIEIELDGVHRIRSWSLQSVGALSGIRGTRLILSGKLGNGEWRILDDTGVALTTSAFYLASKPRVDRIVKHRQLVDTLRVTAVAVTTTGTAPVIFPQIQVFAGEPVIENRMTSNNQDGISVSSSTTDGYRLFDKVVRESTITPIGAANFYLRAGSIRQNKVANSGKPDSLLAADFQSLVWLALTFPSTRLIGYLYSIDKVIGEGGDFESNSYAGTLSFEYRHQSNPDANTAGSGEGGWQSLGLISLDKCVGYTHNIGQGQLTAWLASHQATLNKWAEDVLGLSGQDRDKAYIIDEVNLRAIRFHHSSGTWQDEGLQLNPVLDAIRDVENTTHYADIKGANTAFEQFRFVVRSVMNTINPTNQNPRVQMPEMQFFGLPAGTINAGAVATVTYLKAEDAAGNLHDILGQHRRLPHYNFWSGWWSGSTTSFRLYAGTFQHIKPTDRRLYLSIQNTSGMMTTSSIWLDSSSGTSYQDVSVSGDYRTSPVYFELYVYSVNEEKIVLSSGYTGDRS